MKESSEDISNDDDTNVRDEGMTKKAAVRPAENENLNVNHNQKEHESKQLPTD